MAGDVIATPLSPGAGRSFDCYWPDPYATTQSSVIRLRNGSTIDNVTPAMVGIQGGGVINLNSYLGVDCTQLNCTAAPAGTAAQFSGVGSIHIRTTRGYAPPYQLDPLGFFRLVCVMASGQVPADARDYGFQVTFQASGAYNGLFRGGAVGFGFNVNGLGQVEWVANGPNGTVRTVIAGSDFTHWHAYEMRIQSAQAAADATVTPMIDGVPVQGLPAASLSWAAGTNLPPSQVNVGLTHAGFCPTLVADGGVAGAIVTPFAGVTIQMAPAPWASL